MKGIISTFIDALQNKLGEDIRDGHPLLPWLVEHAASIRNRHSVGSDGKTA